MHNSKTMFMKALLLTLMPIMGCQGKNNAFTDNNQTFGDFSYNGVFLKEYAIKEITASEAKNLVNLPSFSNTKSGQPMVAVDYEESVKSLLSQYASLTATVKYYVTGKEEQQVRVDYYQGTDFASLLTINNYVPFGQMVVRYVYVDDYLIDDMETYNNSFKNDPSNLACPFSEPYTYHIDAHNGLVIQSHHFSELPSSVNGGIGATFRQDCELQFDEQGKIHNWQSSLGLYTSTPTGTVKEGYIFQATFDWKEK